VKVYVVCRAYGAESYDDWDEKFGRPEAVFGTAQEAQDYAGFSGRAITELELNHA
jgi:hypothetical protein